MITKKAMRGLTLLRAAKREIKAGNAEDALRYQKAAIRTMGETPEAWRTGKAIDALQIIPASCWADVTPYIVDLMPEVTEEMQRIEAEIAAFDEQAA